MTAKFEAFKTALHELCVEHGVRLAAHGYEEADLYAQDAEEGQPPFDLCDGTLGTAEEQEASRQQREQETREREAGEQRRHDEWYRERHKPLQARIDEVGLLTALQERIEADAKEQRKQQMRVSTDPNDAAYIDDRPRRVTINDRPVDNWLIADEFRRCVILKSGTVLNGSVWIERLPPDGVTIGDDASLSSFAKALPPIHAGFSGVFVNDKLQATPAPTPAPVVKKPAVKSTKAKRRR